MSEDKGTSFFAKQDSSLERFISNLLLWALYFGMAFVVVMMVITVIHAVGRYGFNSPIPGLVEMSSFMLVLIIFLTAAYTEVEKAHISIGILVDNLPPRIQAVLDCIMYLLSIVVLAAAFWQTINRGLFVKQCEYVSAILHIPHYPFVFIAALGWALLGIAVILRFIRLVGKAFGRGMQ